MPVTSWAGKPFFRDMTEAVEEVVRQAGVSKGLCVVYTHHTTCSVMIQERSLDEAYSGLEFLQQDLWDVLERAIPTCRREGQYLHPGEKATAFAAEHGEDKPEALNTEGHLRSSLLKRSVTAVVREGRVDLGPFGRVYFADFDQTRSRERQVAVCVIGE